MIKAYIESFLAFVKSVFSDAGQGSSSRVLSGAVVFATLGWISYIVLKTKTLPDLGGASMFIASGVGISYGTNKAADIVAAFKGK
jgi:hypothetical protein